MLACWLGGDTLNEARRIFREAGIPTYGTPEEAVAGFLQLVEYRRNQQTLMEAPPSILENFAPDREAARPQAHETIAGAAVDPVFGPVILFGQGGVAVEVVNDRAVALPPLNAVLACELVSRTRISRLLDGYRDRPPADRQALHLALTRVS